MLEKLAEFLESVPMLCVSGVFLLASFILERCGIICPVNPAIVSVILSGIPILYEAIEALFEENGIAKITSALLVSIAMIASIVIGDLFAAGEVAFIMGIGELLEDLTTKRARKGLRKLAELTPKTARIIIGGKEEQIAVEKVQVGDLVRINPGETVPVDGVIELGETSLDQSVITGESIPVDCGVGDGVFSGTTNCYGSIDIRVTKIGENSSLQQMIELVKHAEENQSPMQRTADRYASILVPIAFLLAILTFVITGQIIRGVTVLVVFCPCALVLATPTAVMAAIGKATEKGIVIKSGAALEKMGSVDVVAFDKTGTLTVGKPSVSDVIPLSDVGEGEVLRLAAAAESCSEHPLGKAIATFGLKRFGTLPACTDFRMTSGKGICAVVDGHHLVIGNEGFLAENGTENVRKLLVNVGASDDVTVTEAGNVFDRLLEEGKAPVWVADGGRVIGIIALADALREESNTVIQNLFDLSTDAVLLSGDHRTTAEYIAGKVGIHSVCAGLLPEDKVQKIRNLQQEGHVVCMIGDGVNDAPALETADVGIAMGGTGSDIANNAAEIALATDDIGRIPYLKRLASATVRTIRFGITLSMVINFVAIFLSFFGILNPTTGALVHNAGSILVVLLAATMGNRVPE